jgi:tRNA threonylcarbamoyladenosine biosynthesis protein TsaE
MTRSNSENKIIIKDKHHLRRAAIEFMKLTGTSRIFAFYGAMGSGKTTIIKSICKVMGAVDMVTSPTFTIVNEYRTKEGEFLYHIDLYRIRKTEEVFDFGLEEYFATGSYCFLEWPELIENILPADTVRIRIVTGQNEERILEIE